MPETTRTFRVFVSSTFSDLKAERNALQHYVFPRLRELCLRHGCRFQAIDLRWGVSEEAGRDQQTMKICLNEIARCQDVTPRPNFIVLLGDRYGWRPLPAEIPADEFEGIKSQVNSEADLALLERSYGLDENALYRRRPEDVPVGLYCLQRRKLSDRDGATQQDREAEREAESAAWSQLESELRRILLGAVTSLNLDDEEFLKYTASATEQEIMQGALNVPDAEHNVFGFFRSLQDAGDRPLAENLPADDGAQDFIDLGEDGLLDDRHARLRDLKVRLDARLGRNVHEYSAHWLGTGVGESQSAIALDHIGTLPQDLDECLKLVEDEQAPSLLCVDVWRRLALVILDEIAQIERFSKVERDEEAHQKFGAKRARNFCGRARYLDAVREYVNACDQSPFALWGESGSGKSALLARAGEQIRELNLNAELVVRFIGATPQSSDVRALLESLCHQISGLYGAEQETIPADYNGLTKEFPNRLALATEQKPLVLMLDALDQLSDAEHGRNLSWLPTNLPDNVRVIVSTIPGECLAVLQCRLPLENILQLEPMPVNDGGEVLDLWLEDAGRTLQAHQRAEVLNKFAANGLPLYLKLAFEEARLWHSYTSVSPLAGDVPGIISSLFARLSEEANHGAVMVSRSLGYLAAARNGLTEEEILALLSRDSEVMTEFKRRSVKSPDVDELPVVVWSRLYFDIEPYLTERSADNTSLLTFYHRQLGEVTAEKYLTGADKQGAHKHLADYFASQDYWLETPEQYRNRAGRYPSSARRANLRKAVEFAWQLRQVNDWDRLEQIHTNLDFLESKTAAGFVFELAQDFTEATRIIPADRSLWRIVDLLEEALIRDIHFIARHGSDSPHALFQCLWNACWWYDCPESVRHYETNEGPRSRPGRRLYEFLERWRAAREENHSAFLWIRALRPPSIHLGSAQRAVLQGHEHWVLSVAITTDGRRIVTGSRDNTVRMWDAENGEELCCLGGDQGEVTSVAISSDDRTIVSGSGDSTVRVWDAERREELHCLCGHEGEVTSVAISSDGRRIVSGSIDQTVRVWDAESGEELRCLRGHEGKVEIVAISADGRRMVSASSPRTVRVWDTESGEEISCFRGPKKGWADGIAISTDGRRIVSGSGDKTVRMWDAESWQELCRLRGHENGVTSVAISSDGRRIVSGSIDHTVRVWDAESWEELRCLRGHEDIVRSVAISSDGRRIVSGSWDKPVRVWDAESGEELRCLSGHEGKVKSIAISTDGRRIISGSSDGTVRIWDAGSGVGLRCLRGHEDEVISVAISTDGRRVVSSGDYFDKTVRVWDAESGEELRCLRGHEDEVGSLAISSDNRKIVSGSSDKTVRVWNADSGEELHCLRGHEGNVQSVAISSDGDRIFSGSWDKTVRVWDTESGKELLCLRGHEKEVESIAISRDGGRIVSWDWNETVRVWDARRGKEMCRMGGHDDVDFDAMIRRARGHDELGWSVAISTDGRRVVSRCSDKTDKTMRVWDAESGECMEVLNGRGDLKAIAEGSDVLRFRAIARDTETVIEDSTGQPLAFFPVCLRHLATHPSGRLWAGALGNHVYVIALEGVRVRLRPDGKA